ncbi:MAG: magnesium transporter CorA family protein [Patescibacteria group bacterium]|nr:magnesium transporter CorA family protein [Patescibacteria group bacterium]
MSINRCKKEFDWINIHDLRKKDIEYLRQHFNFHPLDLEDCQSISQRPKIDVYKGYLFVVLHFPYYDQNSKIVNFREIHFFISKDYIVSVKKTHIKVLHDYFLDFSRDKLQLKKSKNSPFHLFYELLEKLYATSLPILDIISKNLNHIEEQIFTDEQKGLANKIAFTRRNILNFRKVIEPQIKIFDKLMNLHKKYIPKGISVYFDDIQDYLERSKANLDNYKDIIEGLGQSHESMISQRTNEVMKILTIISVALLPLNLIAGIYGMNIIGLPFAKNPIIIWLFFIVLIFFISLIILISHKRNVL